MERGSALEKGSSATTNSSPQGSTVTRGSSPGTRVKSSERGPCFSRSDSSLARTSASALAFKVSEVGASERAAWTSTRPRTHVSGRSIFFSTVEETPVSTWTESAPTVRCSGRY